MKMTNLFPQGVFPAFPLTDREGNPLPKPGALLSYPTKQKGTAIARLEGYRLIQNAEDGRLRPYEYLFLDDFESLPIAAKLPVIAEYSYKPDFWYGDVVSVDAGDVLHCVVDVRSDGRNLLYTIVPVEGGAPARRVYGQNLLHETLV